MEKFLKFLKLDSLLDGIKGYIEARVQLLVLEMQEKAAKVITTIIFVVLIAFCSLMMIAFLSVALGNYLNELFGNSYLGFAVLALFYFIMVIILVSNITKGFFHKKVRNSISKSFRKKKKQA